MPIYTLTQQLVFPPVENAEPDGLLAIGGDLSTERLLLAYKNGIFPWYDDDIPLWWCPHPRFVLYPQKLKVSKSMQQVIKNKQFTFTTNKAFAQVIQQCKLVKRIYQDGTWITNDVEAAYTKLHLLGYAHSAEAWQNGKLVGGLYGIQLGNIFFGESMFATVSNASKFAFIQWVQYIQQQGTVLIDCQVYTEHLESLGAEMIDRTAFMKILQQFI
jgi:leucyl/phenylalanyl-tRNA--protein transferase